MARLITLTCLLFCAAFVTSASAQAPAEQLSLTVTASETDHIWTKDPIVISGLVTLPDGQLAVGRVLTVEGRPYPYTGAYTELAKTLVGTNGRFSYSARPTRNMQLRIRTDSGQVSQVFAVRVFHLALDGNLAAIKGGRERATEVSAVPAGYKIAKTYLYLCKHKAKRCTYIATGKTKVKGQQMTASADFTPPTKVKRYSVIFRYVPKPGWGDSTASERRKPKSSIPAS